jgi:hypothetical protein
MSSPPPPPGSSSAPAARSQLLRGETSSEHHRPVPSSTSASAVLPRRLDRLWHPLEAYSQSAAPQGLISAASFTPHTTGRHARLQQPMEKKVVQFCFLSNGFLLLLYCLYERSKFT